MTLTTYRSPPLSTPTPPTPTPETSARARASNRASDRHL